MAFRPKEETERLADLPNVQKLDEVGGAAHLEGHAASQEDHVALLGQPRFDQELARHLLYLDDGVAGRDKGGDDPPRKGELPVGRGLGGHAHDGNGLAVMGNQAGCGSPLGDRDYGLGLLVFREDGDGQRYRGSHQLQDLARLFPYELLVVGGVLDPSRDLVEHLDGLDRKVASGGIVRKHDRVGPVQDGVRDVGNLSPRGPGAVDHGGEHLGSGDDQLPAPSGRLDELFLDERHLLQGHLDSEIPSRDHEAVGHRQYLVEALQGLGLFYLGDKEGRISGAVDELADGLEIVFVPDEAHGHEIDSRLQAEDKVGLVLFGESSDGEVGVGEVHALVGAYDASGQDLGGETIAIAAQNLELQGAVREKDAAPLGHVLQQMRVIDREGVLRGVPCPEDEIYP